MNATQTAAARRRAPERGSAVSGELMLALAACLGLRPWRVRSRRPPSSGPAVGRADRREADRRRRQHLDDPDRQGPRGRAAAEGSQGLAVRGLLRGLLQQEGRPRAALRAQGLLARLGLRHRRQGRPRRHQQPRHRRRRRDHRQLPRRLEAQGRQGHRPRHQGRPRPPQGDAARSRSSRVDFGSSADHEGRRLGDGHRQSVRPWRHGHRRHHLGQAARHQRRPLRRLPADRRRHQQGQLGRSALQHGRRGHRREHGHHLADRRLDRHRLCRARPTP